MTQKGQTLTQAYRKFYKIDGTHPWRDASPDGYVDYPVFYRKGGRVLYFNFPLAREMGLIPQYHPNRMNPCLEETILKTFSLKIINEYDWINKKKFPKDHFTDRLYMATRYLQLQHPSKRGETSGDGRSIWNGYLKTSRRVFDISSRGTGSTILSPGIHEAGEFIETGNNKYGYASGLAQLDEMLASAIMSEIFFHEGIPTERCLAVIDYKDKTSIGVRCAPNLLRPAHFFRFLKLGQWQDLKSSFDYFLTRQQENGGLRLPKQKKKRYLKSLEYLTQIYAKLVAVLEEEYIFNWLSWDGDNMLATGAVLDYGSIRQFAAKHDKYRYEDVDRYSTCLREQRIEARRIVQTFVQMIDFIITQKKKSFDEFADHLQLKVFDECFKRERQRRMLWRMGFSSAHIKKLMKYHQKKVEAFQDVLNYFEGVKTVDGLKRLSDGVDHPPVFLVRHILRELPNFILNNYRDDCWPMMQSKNFCHIMAGSYVDSKDLEINAYREDRAQEFQRLYRELIEAVNGRVKSTLKVIVRRTKVINYPFRRTGDGLIWIVKEAIAMKDRMDRGEIQEAIDRFIESQVLVPEKCKLIDPKELKGRTMKARLLRKMQKNLQMFDELI